MDAPQKSKEIKGNQKFVDYWVAIPKWESYKTAYV